MAKADVTAAYVNLITHYKYETRTSDTTEFEALKDIYDVYLNSSVCAVPDAKYTHGLALLVAHYYALDDTKQPDAGGPDTGVGNITTERVGDLTQVRGAQPYFGDVQGWKLWLSQTQYGSEFLYLMKTFKPTPIVL